MEFEFRVHAGEDRRFSARAFDHQLGKTLMVAGTAVTMLAATVEEDGYAAVLRFHAEDGTPIEEAMMLPGDPLVWTVADMSTGEIREDIRPARPVTPEEFLQGVTDLASSERFRIAAATADARWGPGRVR